MNTSTRITGFLLVLSTLLTTGCSIDSRVEKFMEDGCDLDFEFELGPHTADFVEIDLLDKNNSTSSGLTFRAQFDPLGVVERRLLVPEGVGDGFIDLEFIADFNGNQTRDNPNEQKNSLSDHSWIVEDICAGQAEPFVHSVDLVQNLTQQVVERDVAFVANVDGASVNAAMEIQILQVVEIDGASQLRPAGLYRRDIMTESDRRVTINGIRDLGFDYVVMAWTDTNKNGAADSVDRFISANISREETVEEAMMGIALNFDSSSAIPPFDLWVLPVTE